jgi:hypothetical protein
MSQDANKYRWHIFMFTTSVNVVCSHDSIRNNKRFYKRPTVFPALSVLKELIH